MTSRKASHAGSWYSSSSSTLSAELDSYLQAVPASSSSTPWAKTFEPPVKGCKAIIAPHAGFSYSGPTAAWAYKAVDTSSITRVFILGPSHHVYLDGCALSACSTYETPIGSLNLHLELIAELRNTGRFTTMTLAQDEEEHSIEMHLPLVRKIFDGKDIKIIPILVGSISKTKEASFGELLAPYLNDPSTLTIVSSDFCHWGSRFSYTYYSPPAPSSTPVSLSSAVQPSPEKPIHISIELLDREAMEILQSGGSSEGKEWEDVHGRFESYLKRTKNTICGRHPIGVLLGALTHLKPTSPSSTDASSSPSTPSGEISFVHYEQSSPCIKVRDSSVSYASAFVRW
ncbi:MEMO1 family [Mrakia frigida]|uniref:Mho1p n=1 Tax=Mrakia frigida TaxID=29902 RepID=UPI003FCC03D3